MTVLWVVAGPVPTAALAVLAWKLEGRVSLPAAETPLTVPLLYVLAAGEWVATLVVEHLLKRQATSLAGRAGESGTGGAQSPLVRAQPVLLTMVVLLAALGTSIAVYGLMVFLLGFGFKAAAPFFVIAGAHLMAFRLRFRRFVESLGSVAAGAPPSIG